jgi:hypothetical protein
MLQRHAVLPWSKTKACEFMLIEARESAMDYFDP